MLNFLYLNQCLYDYWESIGCRFILNCPVTPIFFFNKRNTDKIIALKLHKYKITRTIMSLGKAKIQVSFIDFFLQTMK